MWLANWVVGSVLDALLIPFRSMPPAVGLAAISVLAAIGMLLVFKATSDQLRLATVKRRIHAAILEIRLLNEDPRFVLAAQRDALLHSFSYLRLTVVPLLWMSLPLIILMAHLQTVYGYTGLAPGETAIVRATVASGPESMALLTGDDGIEVQTPLLWIPSRREASWRIAATSPGQRSIRLTVGDSTWTKSVLVSGSAGRRSARRPSAGLLDQLLHPGERPLKGGRVTGIEITYDDATVSLFGWDIHWLPAFFLMTLVAALALRGVMRVTF